MLHYMSLNLLNQTTVLKGLWKCMKIANQKLVPFQLGEDESKKKSLARRLRNY